MQSNESTSKIFFVTILLCLVCSILVASTAVLLQKRQNNNKKLDIEKNILEVAGLLQPNASVSRNEILKISKEHVQAKLIDLRTGKFYQGLDVNTYDASSAIRDPQLSKPLTEKNDPAMIKRLEHYAKVFLIDSVDDKPNIIVLPVRGYGLWSTLYGFLALKKDLKTIEGLTFYDQKETPGLGGEVDNPRWKAQWHNKLAYTNDGKLSIHVVKGGISSNEKIAIHQVDAISGATLTSRGVDHLVNFWLGPQGFGPFLQKLANGEA